MSGPLSDSPTRTIVPMEPTPEQVTATLAPPGELEARDGAATRAPQQNEDIHFTRPFEGVGSPTSFPTPDDRYTLSSFLARGGMGEVWIARDRVLNRDVAVKILRDDLKQRSFVSSRFIEEARITGKLEHPGIPPIHDLGTFKDGRPFIAMKLIKQGRTLSDLLANDPPDLAERLRIFEDVCHAVASAHERRVIHRDLKPGNVMVGRFNEVQVMDWGLAKVLGETAGAADEQLPVDHPTTSPVSVIESDRDPSSHTRAGSLLGTPAYMPPEQAKGEVDKTDTRSDVFALGAMLCELLTGRPPYWAATSAEIQAYAITSMLGPARERLEASNADPELVALAKHCLSPNQDDRPADAKRVAETIKRYRESVQDRLRQAERDRAAAEAKASEALNTRREAEARVEAEQAKAVEHRKRRRVQLALAAAGMFIVLGAGAAAWWGDQQANEKDRLEREKQAELDRLESDRQAVVLRQQAEKQQHLQRNDEAIETLLVQVEAAIKADVVEKAEVPFAQIEKRLSEGGADHLTARIAQARADITMLKKLDEVDGIIGQAETQMRTQANKAYTAAFKNYGIDLETERSLNQELVLIEDAIRLVNGSTIRERLLLGLDLWYLHYPKITRPIRLRRILDGADPDRFRNDLRNLVERGDEAVGSTLLEDPQAFRQPARVATLIGQQNKFPTSSRDRVLRSALERFPNDFPLLLTMVTVHENSKEDRSETILQQFRWSQAAVAVRPQSKVAWRHLARAHWDRGNLDDANRCYKWALHLDPADVNTLLALGAVLTRKHDPEAALVFVNRALELYPNSSYAHSMLGSVYDRMGQYDDAFKEIEKAIEIDGQTGVENATYYNNRGYAYLRRGDTNAAIRDFQDALRLNKDFRLAETNLNYARELRKGDREIEVAPPPHNSVAPSPQAK